MRYVIGDTMAISLLRNANIRKTLQKKVLVKFTRTFYRKYFLFLNFYLECSSYSEYEFVCL